MALSMNTFIQSESLQGTRSGSIVFLDFVLRSQGGANNFAYKVSAPNLDDLI
jgi:hypothetical protein